MFLTPVTQNHPVLSHIGDMAIKRLLKINRFTNRVRRYDGHRKISRSDKLIKPTSQGRPSIT